MTTSDPPTTTKSPGASLRPLGSLPPDRLQRVGEQTRQARRALPSDAIEVDEALAQLQAQVEALKAQQAARDEWEAKTDAKLDRPSTVRLEVVQACPQNQIDEAPTSSARRSARWLREQWESLPPWAQVLVIVGTNVLTNLAQRLLE